MKKANQCQGDLSKQVDAKLILVRGLPGSGKSTKAKQLASELNAIHLEADQFFTSSAGDYQFDASLLPDAHLWCFEQTKGLLRQGMTVIVSNTFIQHWEMQPYISFAKEQMFAIEVIVCREQYQNIHDVPEQILASMKQNWQE